MRRLRIAVAVVSAACVAFAAGAGAEEKVQASALEQIRLLQQEKEGRTKVQRKIQSRLLFALYKQRSDPRLAAFPQLRIASADRGGRMLVDVDLASGASIKPVVSELERAGAEIVAPSFRFRTIRARLPLDQVERIAGLSSVRKVLLAREAVTHKVNTSEGDVAHRAAEARGYFGVDGTGQKVCVLSDGVTNLAASQASGDLPFVDVLPGQAGSGDEGTAMLEIVHDLAPGAALGFATAFTSEASFAQNILDLAADGCTVIVDDVIYFDESPFQDNIVAQSVNSVTASGVLYFSSAGNEGNKNDATSGTWEGDFLGNGTVPGVTGTAHDFGDGGQSILVTASASVNVLNWTDPYGASGNDYDIYDMDGGLTTIFDFSTEVQDGNDDPFEIFGASFAGERLVIAKVAGADRMLNLIAFRGELDPTLSTNGATRGHSAAVDAYSVAAVDANTGGGAGGAFDGSESVETFSSDGPRRIFFDGSGNLLPGAPAADFSAAGGVVRPKPDIAAADGVSTAAPGFNPFFGTSAAAPHAAAIAALVKQAFPGFTPAQVRTALTTSALDIEAVGADRDSGAGIVMAYETLSDNGAPAVASLSVDTATPTQVTGDGDAFIEPGEKFDLSVSLKNVGGASATSVSGVLSTSTPGVTIFPDTAPWPDIAPTSSEQNLVPFRFKVGPALACGSTIHFTLTANFTGGPTPNVVEFTLPTGAVGAPSVFSYTGPPVAIPDGLGAETPGATADAPLAVSGLSGALGDLDFRVDGATCSTGVGATTVGLDHSWVGDLVVELESPTGTRIPLVQRMGGGGNSGHNFCQTVLDDEAGGGSIQGLGSGSAPFTGTFQPATPLSSFDGEAGNGTWTLHATDYFNFDTGAIRAFSLIASPAVCDAPVTNSYVTVTSPDTAGIVWQAGKTKPIRFIHNLGKNQPVKIEINRDYPAGAWVSIANPFLTNNAGNGSYKWLVSGVTTNARIRITAVDSGAEDTNNADFAISGRVKVKTPNTAVTWAAGSKKTIKWSHSYGLPAAFNITLDNDGDGDCDDAVIQNGVAATSATAGSYTWTVAGTGSLNRVCVSKSPADPDGSDASDVPFTITP
jgi:subtilisin-like proprotein convertase family protein